MKQLLSPTLVRINSITAMKKTSTWILSLGLATVLFSACDTTPTPSSEQPSIAALLERADATEVNPVNVQGGDEAAKTTGRTLIQTLAYTIQPGRAVLYSAPYSAWVGLAGKRVYYTGSVARQDLLVFVITQDASGNVRRVLRQANRTGVGGQEETYFDPSELTPADARAGFLLATASGQGGSMQGRLEVETLSISSSAGFLAFPLDGDTPYTVRISGVLDHSMSTGGNCADGLITAYTGEVGRRSAGQSVWSTDNGCGTVRGFKQTSGAVFSIGGQYATGDDGPRYLFYDGHTGYDYPRTNGTNVKAAAAGTARHYNVGAERSVSIVHPNGYETFYLHLSRRDVADGQTVRQGQVIGGVGSGHLHFTVKKGSVRVDPYGWKGTPGADPLRVDGKDNVCLWTTCR